jgi:hypothetical protein
MLRRHRCRFSRVAVFAGTATATETGDADDAVRDDDDAVRDDDDDDDDPGANAENKTCEGPANESIILPAAVPRALLVPRFKDPSAAVVVVVVVVVTDLEPVGTVTALLLLLLASTGGESTSII